MTSATQKAKAFGFKDLNAVAEIVGKHRNTLARWGDENPQLLEVVLTGAAEIVALREPPSGASVVTCNNAAELQYILLKATDAGKTVARWFRQVDTFPIHISLDTDAVGYVSRDDRSIEYVSFAAFVARETRA